VLEGAVDVRRDRPGGAVGHPGREITLSLGLRDPLDQGLGDGELVLQQPHRALAQVVGNGTERRRRDPLVGAPSPRGDLIGAAVGEGLLGGEHLALELAEDRGPVDRRPPVAAAARGRTPGSRRRRVRALPEAGGVGSPDRAGAGPDGLPANEAAACRHASRSGSTTWRQDEMRLVSSLMLACTSSLISQL
jgi:hypothetical protein